MRNPELPNGNAVFCDDLRAEVGNKLSIMGIYTGQMLLASGTTFPAAIPKLCIVMNWRDDPDEVPDELTFKVYFPDGETEQEVASLLVNAKEILAKTGTPPAIPGLQILAGLSPIVVLQPFVVAQPGRISVRVERKGEVWRIGTLTISTAPQPPTTS